MDRKDGQGMTVVFSIRGSKMTSRFGQGFVFYPAVAF